MQEAHKNKKLSEEHKKKISESLGQGINNVNYGRKQTDEAKKNNSLAKTGKNHPNWEKHLKDSTKEKIKEGNSRKVLQYSIDGEFIKEWDSAKEAALKAGFNRACISQCCAGKIKSHREYIFKLKK